jgi:TRAP-type uncharacterized transport system substrate-binding protein
LPESITIATGPESGEWDALSQNLHNAIEANCEGVNVKLENTRGALHHLELLKKTPNDGGVHFALYLRGSRRMQARRSKESGRPPAKPNGTGQSATNSGLTHHAAPMLVGNVYSDITLFLIRRDLYESEELRTVEDLARGAADGSQFRVAVGQEETGEYSIAMAMLEYFFGTQRGDFEERPWNYKQVKEGFGKGLEDGTSDQALDAAFITAGHQAPIFRELIEQEGWCEIGAIPSVEAITMRNVGLTRTAVPRGLFRYKGQAIPAITLETVGAHTMLLAHPKVSVKMVEEVTKILISEDFIQENQLFELSKRNPEFAQDNPEFSLHPGAMNVYDPRLKPLIDPDFMEATESARSFAFSLLIGGFFAWQWYRRRRERRKDHRLDEYFAELLQIDRTALPNIENSRDAEQMQQTLERVIELRNEALREFSAKDFDEDSAADSFLSLCHTVAAGLRAQLLRWQFRQGTRMSAEVAEEADSVGQREAAPAPSSEPVVERLNDEER